MLAYSDNNPQEFEFLQGGILVRWEVEEGKDPKDGHTTYTYWEIKVELDDPLDTIMAKLANANYTDNVMDFANRIIAFRDAK